MCNEFVDLRKYISSWLEIRKSVSRIIWRNKFYSPQHDIITLDYDSTCSAYVAVTVRNPFACHLFDGHYIINETSIKIKCNNSITWHFLVVDDLLKHYIYNCRLDNNAAIKKYFVILMIRYCDIRDAHLVINW